MYSPFRKHSATQADLDALPPHLVGEIIEGSLYASPRPAIPHAHAAKEAIYDLNGPFQRDADGPGGWWLLMEPELRLHGQVMVPDLAGWRRDRVPSLPATARLEIVPDWVCEVLSPSTHRIDRLKKLPIYAAWGVGHAWLIDPAARTVEVYRHHEDTWLWLLTADGDSEEPLRLPPFDAVGLDLRRWWLAPGDDEPDPPLAAESAP